MADLKELEIAYINTTYQATFGQSRIELRVGILNHEFDGLLKERGVGDWAFITAFNPNSIALSDEANQRRHQLLVQRVNDLGYEAFDGLGIGDDSTWPPEKSLLIVGIDEETAKALGHEFGQSAILIGGIHEPPQLLMLKETDDSYCKEGIE
jgi:hypothetical protein